MKRREFIKSVPFLFLSLFFPRIAKGKEIAGASCKEAISVKHFISLKDGMGVQLLIADKNRKVVNYARQIDFQSDEFPMSDKEREKFLKKLIVRAAQGIFHSRNKIMDSVRREGLTWR